MTSVKLNITYVLPAFPVFSETFIGNEIRAMEAPGHRKVPLGEAANLHSCADFYVIIGKVTAS